MNATPVRIQWIKSLIDDGDIATAKSLLPHEHPYELPPELAAHIGATP